MYSELRDGLDQSFGWVTDLEGVILRVILNLY